ncbi:MAG: hypothetical protein H7Z43_13460 [Clostridia bacterium]|nr:hypothetical protein [Deltaproteobacteria bacterium]
MIGLAYALLLSAPQGLLVDWIVVVVDKEAVTRSELITEARIALAYRGGETSEAAALDDDFLNGFRDYLVSQIIIASQARRLGASDVAEDEVNLEVDRFASGFRSPAAYEAFLRRFDIPVDTLRDVLRRDLRNARFIDQRMRARTLVSENDPDRDAQYMKALERWLAELRAAADVRLPGKNGELEVQDANDAAGNKR